MKPWILAAALAWPICSLGASMAAPAQPAALALSVTRDGETLARLPLCVAAGGEFSGEGKQDDAAFSMRGQLLPLKGKLAPVLSFQLSWRDADGERKLASQLQLEEAEPTLLGSLPQQVYPYGRAPGVEPQTSSLSFYLEPRKACPPPSAPQ
ncbi:hypothetical protein [Chromobacterium sp. IIBBL 290-4]|uniref:hypothetical protein n=1 Tax=Chromobacterium sp. IIBBL 290-4 TaxID=2953890 RepID=UPI0020B74F25|nr:hypothetical protein [Chromobacterium sp. IIBBL 290-4]UTH75784.1 hypothetical protein NKT35_06700 [Chromobacterium sp. IIBBL 290-4]